MATDVVAGSPPRSGVLAGRSGRLVAVLLLVILLALHQLVSYGSDSAIGGTLRNALHIPLFAFLTLLLARILDYPAWWVLLLGALALGLGTEALQLLTSRNASLRDVAIDLIGIAPVVLGLAGTRHLRTQGRTAAIAALWLGIATLLLLATVAAPVRLLVTP